ncbi:MAG: hypoxanthine phosphoribosyltransferase [Bacteroidales bacterium]|nr:hypoxanthine phosphoribosyltransferase [Bacteroidales bacterium]
MEKIQVHDKTFRLMIPYSEIEKAIDAVAEKINRDYQGKEGRNAILCILNGSILFTSELMKRSKFDAELLTMKISSYEGTTSTGIIREVIGLSGDVAGKNILIVEDIVDSGNTIEVIYNEMKAKGAAEVKVCTMLSKPGCYKKDIPLDYVALEIPDDFVVGFGLDYNELGRNYKNIYTLDK